MEQLTAETAEAALHAAVDADNTAPAPAQEQAPTPQADAAPSEPSPSNQDDPGLFYGVDPETLTPEMRTMFDGMQSAFTQKSQEVAARRRELEILGPVEQVQQAVKFVEALQDPENLVQLHGELSEYLQSIGYTKAQADEAAASEVQTRSLTEAGGDDDEFVDPSTERLQNELSELKQWRTQMDQERLRHELELSLTRQEQAIRTANPNYDDKDVEAIYRMSYAYGADLMAAQEAYETDRSRIIQSYASRKQEVPPMVAPPTAGAEAQRVETFGDDFEAAHKFAKAKVAALESQGAFD